MALYRNSPPRAQETLCKSFEQFQIFSGVHLVQTLINRWFREEIQLINEKYQMNFEKSQNW